MNLVGTLTKLKAFIWLKVISINVRRKGYSASPRVQTVLWVQSHVCETTGKTGAGGSSVRNRHPLVLRDQVQLHPSSLHIFIQRPEEEAPPGMWVPYLRSPSTARPDADLVLKGKWQ
jgi:hypothetical protein